MHIYIKYATGTTVSESCVIVDHIYTDAEVKEPTLHKIW